MADQLCFGIMMNRTCTIRICTGVWVFMFLITYGHAQEIIDYVHVKEFDSGVNGHPYEVGGWNSNIMYKSHDPAISLPNGDFVYLWEPSKGFRKRILVKFNVLLEESWRHEFKLDSEEAILHLYESDSAIMLLTRQYDYRSRLHSVMYRSFSKDSGNVSKAKFFHRVSGRYSDIPFMRISNDGQSLMFYQYINENKNKRVRLYGDFQFGDERLGYRITQATHLQYAQYNLQLEKIREGNIELNLKDNKTYVLDCHHDSKGNIYISKINRAENFSISRFDVSTENIQELSVNEFPKFWEEEEPYYTLMPPYISDIGRAYIALADRRRMRGSWHTQNIEIVSFDFEANKVDRSRSIETNSSLLVKISKAREKFGIRPARKFDSYVLKEIIERDNGELLLLSQRFYIDQFRHPQSSPQDPMEANFRLEEIVMYQFDALGNFMRAIIIPCLQRNIEDEDIEGMFFEAHLVEEEGSLHIVTHEVSGEEVQGPARTYFRRVDLDTGEVTDRKKIFEGKRRGNHFYKHYTEWLNNSLLALTVEDGDDGRTYVITVNLDGENKPILAKKEKVRKRDK